MIRGWIQVIWRFSQVGLAGLFVMAAGMLAQNGEPLPTSPLGLELKALGRALKSHPQSAAPDAAAFLEKAKGVASLDDLLNLPVSPEAKSLLQRMQADEFDQGNPFLTLASVYPMALLLSRDVKSYSRGAYRSTQFLGGVGYDVVKYEVEDANGGLSFILAYKEKTAANQVAIGARDRRPTFSLFIIPQDETQVFYSLFQDGQLIENQAVPREQAVLQVTQRIEQSTPLLTARDSH